MPVCVVCLFVNTITLEPFETLSWNGSKIVKSSNEFLTFVLPVRFKLSTQIRDTSSWCPQLWTPHPRCSHSSSALSLPRQLTSSIQVLPVAVPNGFPLTAAPCFLIHKILKLTRDPLTSDYHDHYVPSCLWLMFSLYYLPLFLATSGGIVLHAVTSLWVCHSNNFLSCLLS